MKKLKNKKIVITILTIILIIFVFKFYFKIVGSYKERKTINHMIKTNYKKYDIVENIPRVSSTKNNDIPYIGILEIPKINLIKGLVDINDKNNNVDKNIQIIKSSTFPTIENGNLILAAHSGNNHNAYFKDLHKINVKDIIYIYYNNQKYIFKIVSRYNVKKNEVVIKRNINKTCITLITCDQERKGEQIVFIGELN